MPKRVVHKIEISNKRIFMERRLNLLLNPPKTYETTHAHHRERWQSSVWLYHDTFATEQQTRGTCRFALPPAWMERVTRDARIYYV